MEFWRGSEKHWLWLVIRALLPLVYAFGAGDRLASVLLLFIFGDIAEGMKSSAHAPFALFIAIPLLVHLFLPPAPYGSLAARGRVDPRGGWSFSPKLLRAVRFAAVLVDAWVVVPAVRGNLSLDLVAPAIFVNLLAFDPAWIRRTHPGTTDLVFYDGTCGLCHRGVRFLLAEDRTGTAFTFAPLGGDLFRQTIGDQWSLPDSMVVRTAGGETLLRSSAGLHLLKRLGGWWRVLATVCGAAPRPLRDAVYDRVARVRYRMFGRAPEACPILPPDLRSRFAP
jgi:predicted DCC family thiol-disulfide oxidoreductase YuxK